MARAGRYRELYERQFDDERPREPGSRRPTTPQEPAAPRAPGEAPLGGLGSLLPEADVTLRAGRRGSLTIARAETNVTSLNTAVKEAVRAVTSQQIADSSRDRMAAGFDDSLVRRGETSAQRLSCHGSVSWCRSGPVPRRSRSAEPPRRGRRRPPRSSLPTTSRPGDVLRIAVWKEPELSTEVFVRLDGMITVSARGRREGGRARPPSRSRPRCGRSCAPFLEVPQVTVTVAQAVSARFYVIGEVAVSGAFPLTGRITFLQALALAGGFREFAKRERIIVIRERRGERQAIVFNFRDLEAGINLEQNITVEAGDTLIVP